ncbi:hypothetical protein ACHHYP_11343 [Achlya hypogyna]|uniref:TIR domain-containing protein n=1 Tax=Achlya hypogyna TaxID=1202772 RepID=A0A1V9YJB6_ACHHY|nr:hypothetical protein ACHHYP_11343 [Achlya hypogyna]
MGAAASTTRQVYDKAQCQALCGDLFNDELWREAATNDVISHEKLTLLFHSISDVVLLHDGVTAHARTLSDGLRARGFTTWLREPAPEEPQRPSADGPSKSAVKSEQAIDNARCIVVVVTQPYVDKFGRAEDACFLEFTQAERRHTAARMLAVVADAALADTERWPSDLRRVFRRAIAPVDVSVEVAVAQHVDALVAQITSVIGLPMAKRFERTIAAAEAPSSELKETSTATDDPKEVTRQASETKLTPAPRDAAKSPLLEAKDAASEIKGATPEANSAAAEVKEASSEAKDADSTRCVSALPVGRKESDASAGTASFKAKRVLAPAPAPESNDGEFEKLTAALVDASFVAVYDYAFAQGVVNRAFPHELHVPASCTVGKEAGLALSGAYLADLRDREELLSLGPAGSRLHKTDFLLRLRLWAQDPGFVLAGGRFKSWFSLELTTENHVVVAFNKGADTFPITRRDEPFVLPTNAWIDFALRVNVAARVLQVVVGNARLDDLSLPPGFRLSLGKALAEGSLQLYDAAHKAKLFCGYIHRLELFSANLALPPAPAVPAAFAEKKTALCAGLTQLCDYPFEVDLVDRVAGRSFPAPASSYVHPEHGLFLDGDYYGEHESRPGVACVGAFAAQMSKSNFVVAASLCPLGEGWVWCFGKGWRWFGILVLPSMALEMELNHQATRFPLTRRGQSLVLRPNEWVHLAVKAAGKRFHIFVDGDELDPIELGAKFDYWVGEGDDNAILLHGDSANEAYYGLMKHLEFWSSPPPAE